MKRSLIIICILLIIGVGLHLPYDAWISAYVAPWVKTVFEQSGCCCMHSARVSCTLLAPSITFHDVHVTPQTGQLWSWHAERYTIGFSWLSLILYGMLDLQITLDNLQAHSLATTCMPAITEHIICLTTGQAYTIPSFIAACTFNNAHIAVHNQEKQWSFSTAFDVRLRRIDAAIQGIVHMRDGTIRYADIPCVTLEHGRIQATIPMHGTHHTASLQLALKPCQSALSGSIVHVDGQWEQAQGTLRVRTDETVLAECTQITYDDDHAWRMCITGSVPCSTAASLLGVKPFFGTLHVKGDMRTDGTVHTCNDLHLVLDDVHIPAVRDIAYTGSITCAGTDVSGAGVVSCKDTVVADTIFVWDWNKQRGSVTCTNPQTYAIPFMPTWAVQPRAVHVAIDRTAATINGTIDGALRTTGTTSWLQPCTVNFMVHDNVFELTGSHEMGMLEVTGTVFPTPSITRALLYDRDHQVLVRARNYPQKYDKLHAQITSLCMQRLCSSVWGYMLAGDGVYSCDLRIGTTIDGRVRMQEGALRLPGVQNFIHDVDVFLTYDPQTHTGTVTQGLCRLDRGIVRVHDARIVLQDDGTIQLFYMPITAHHCMFVLDRGIFALLSADVCITKHAQEPIVLDGSIVIDQAHIEGNIFSPLLQRTIAASTRDTFLRNYAEQCVCALTCDSVKPICIKTAFVETYADLSLRITGKASQPALFGKINLQGGSLLFPYKPLYITRGTIYIDERDPHDSLIELVASNKIRQYDISMMVSGSLQNNTVALHAAPSLSEEQIVSLLLVGSYAESLNMVMPALIMHNLSSFIFDQKQSPSQFRAFFGRLLQPFEHIHFVPVFADQSGRGGLRGTLEIDLSDRLRAMIQKNFSLLEDTRVEIEYAVSDDIVVRGMRNERRDVGGEVEFKWKF